MAKLSLQEWIEAVHKYHDKDSFALSLINAASIVEATLLDASEEEKLQIKRYWDENGQNWLENFHGDDAREFAHSIVNFVYVGESLFDDDDDDDDDDEVGHE